jgi:DnaJ-class molecular chaperone
MFSRGRLWDILMQKRSPPSERRCDACNGTGFSKVKQPATPGRKIYPPRCTKCDGKGRIPATSNKLVADSQVHRASRRSSSRSERDVE